MKVSTLNVLLVINKDFEYYANEVFNPRNRLLIDMNDGYFNTDYGMQRDTLINMTTYGDIGREAYSAEQILAIKHAIGR